MAVARRKAVLRRKNLILDQVRIDRARSLMGAATETETITRALDAAIDLAQFRAEASAGLRRAFAVGGFTNRVDDGDRE